MAFSAGTRTSLAAFRFLAPQVMQHLRVSLLLLAIASSRADSGGGSHAAIPASPLPANELGLAFGHTVNKREQLVTIFFDVANATLQDYRYYYFDFRPFGSPARSEYLPRQRLVDAHNSLRIVGLHEGDYVSCVTLVDEYGTVLKPRYACYEFTLGEKIVGSHHGSKSGYLVPLLIAVAFVLQTFIAVVHHIKAKNYAHKLLHRFRNVSSRGSRRKIIIHQSMKELDHPHVPASVQRRLSRVSVDASHDTRSDHERNFTLTERIDELPLYTIARNGHSLHAITEHEQSNTLGSIASTRHLIGAAASPV